jgi:membrane protein
VVELLQPQSHIAGSEKETLNPKFSAQNGFLFMDKRQLYNIFKTAFIDWLEDNATLRAAALTFFIIIPLPTLLLIIVAVFTAFLGETQAVQIVVQQITAIAGPSVADLFRQLLVSSASPFTSVWTALVVIGFSVGGAIGTFAVLRDTMNCIWDVTLRKGEPLWKRGREKVVPFVLLTVLGLIVIVWTGVTAMLFDAIREYSINTILTFIGLEIAQVLSSFAVAFLLLAIIYKMIPEATVHWRDVALATLIASVAFTVANYIFGFYVQTFVVTTVGGAAGALLIILLWIFVLNLILLYGAEVSKVYAVTVGTHSAAYLPAPVQKVIEPLQKLGSKIEQASKEEVVKTGEETSQPERELVAEKGHVTGLPAEEKPAPQSQVLEETIVAKADEGNIEFQLKIKKPKKKQPKTV